MKTKYNIEEEIAKTLDAYQHQQMPELNPYFNSRLQARLEGAQKQTAYSPAKLKFSLVAALFFVLINAVSIFSYVQNSNKQLEEAAISVLSADYASETTNIYAYTFENE